MNELFKNLVKEIKTQQNNAFDERNNIARELEIYELSERYEELKDLPKLIGLEEKSNIESRKKELDEKIVALDRCNAKLIEL